MNKQLYILTLALAASSVSSQAFAFADTRLHSTKNVEQLLIAPDISYNRDVIESPGWKGNWFIGINAGANAFFESPQGCSDLWGKIKPHFGAYMGKWFTPTVGSRVSFNGFQLVNADKNAQNYWGFSTDFLWNLTEAVYGNKEQTRFGLIPYVGVGMLHNKQAGTNPFALSYGVMAQYGLTPRLKVTMEFGGKTTFSDFDGIGKANRFGGDNILSLSAGLSFTFGQNGFRKVINAKPVMIDNARLRETLAGIYEENAMLSRQASNDARIIAELKKILEIEGLLSRYGNLFGSSTDNDKSMNRPYPVNDYSGLNKLRARLKGYYLSDKRNGNMAAGLDNESDEALDVIDQLFASDEDRDSTSMSGSGNTNGVADNLSNSGSESGKDDSSNLNHGLNGFDKENYLALISSGKKCIGSPIYFFFRLGTSDLTDPSQLVNLDEIARIAKAYRLSVRITGAADSATGTTDINKGLGNDRANYIKSQLQERGISASLITKINKGGIDILNPDEANRHCKLELFVCQ